MSVILVTGGTGFTGGAMCRRLVESGHSVRAFVRSLSNAGALQTLGLDVRVVDLVDRDAVLRNFAGVDLVYHIAAAYRSELVDHKAFWDVNVGGTENLIAAAKTHGVERFVHCSTVGVQGEIEDPPASEEYRLSPGDHYQESKLEGERRVCAAMADGLPAAVVRPVGIYGPGDTRFLKLFRPISKRRFVMIGNGQVLYHLTYIDDLIDGFELAGTHPAAVGETFTIAGEHYSTIKELVQMIAAVLNVKPPRLSVPFAPVYAASVVCDKLCRGIGVSPPLYPRRVEFFQLDRAFSIDKAKALLGYAPKFGLTRGLTETAAWYRSQGLI